MKKVGGKFEVEELILYSFRSTLRKERTFNTNDRMEEDTTQERVQNFRANYISNFQSKERDLFWEYTTSDMLNIYTSNNVLSSL